MLTRSSTTAAPPPPELAAERARACRLTPDRALATLDEARAFLADRGLLTLTPDCALPSLFGACHEPPAFPGKAGFGAWPRTKWPWGGELALAPGVLRLKIHRGKGLFLAPGLVSLVAPLGLRALAEADDGRLGRVPARVVRILARQGPLPVEDLKARCDLTAREGRAVIDKLAATGAIVPVPLTVDTKDGGHRHTADIRRFDQVIPAAILGAAAAADPEAALLDLVAAGVRAAVIAPAREVGRWFTWTFPRDGLDRLAAAGAIVRPAPGWVAAPPAPS